MYIVQTFLIFQLKLTCCRLLSNRFSSKMSRYREYRTIYIYIYDYFLFSCTFTEYSRCCLQYSVNYQLYMSTVHNNRQHSPCRRGGGGVSNRMSDFKIFFMTLFPICRCMSRSESKHLYSSHPQDVQEHQNCLEIFNVTVSRFFKF